MLRRTKMVEWCIKNWLKPWAKTLGEAGAKASWLEHAFRVDERRIDMRRARTNLIIPGEYLDGCSPVPGLRLRRERTVKMGAIAWIRDDPREDYIEIETAHATFRLPRAEGVSYVEKNFSPRPGDSSGA